MESRHYYTITPLAYTGRATAFTYHHDGEILAAGQLVEVPIGPRRVVGIVDATSPHRPSFATKPITRVIDQAPITPDLRELAAWLSRYYAASPASVWSTILPAGLAKTRRSTSNAPAAPTAARGLPASPLTAEQTAALARIRGSHHTAHLVQGVTGSGKTRLYLELAAEALAASRSVIVLVPEITLTHQIVAEFEAAFGNQVLTTHSKLTEAKRHSIWNAAATAAAAGQPRIIVGPRSCLFLPAHQLGLIVIDECHETTYKQDQHPRYHAIPTAAYRARTAGARLVLGSATPGLGELYLAQQGRLEHIYLSTRANNIPLPQAKIIDLREKNVFTLSKFITQPLIAAITATMAAGRQTLLYLNRRGSASSQICGDCGAVSLCPRCNLPLTFHADLLRLICHHCNFRRTADAVCPSCGSANLRLLGGGTKRIEAEVERLWPEARVARLDRDSATLPHIKQVFKQLRAGELDILIGTQMIAKGLDLPAIDTVGVVSADTMLYLPDFTAAEHTYQLISQVSGRTGRGDRPGQIFIQTYTPEHPAIVAAASGAFDHFAAGELAERQALNYPPYVYLLKLTIALPNQAAAVAEATRLATELRRPNLTVIGPAPAFIETQAGKYHWMLIVKAKSRPPLIAIAAGLPSDHWTADLDPVNLL
ncbi:MAG TPA: primosomal protein N' [Candidatus Saccharimonadia bacterium]|nr:primosomal protein N' [Candidatus Saccharimonadia bacterium]